MKKRFICFPDVPGSSAGKRAYLGRLIVKKTSICLCLYHNTGGQNSKYKLDTKFWEKTEEICEKHNK